MCLWVFVRHECSGYNAIRFFFQAACRVFPVDRLKHRGTVLALKKARETFVVTTDGMHASVFVTLDQLIPNSIALCSFEAPMRHQELRTASASSLILMHADRHL